MDTLHIIEIGNPILFQIAEPVTDPAAPEMVAKRPSPLNDVRKPPNLEKVEVD